MTPDVSERAFPDASECTLLHAGHDARLWTPRPCASGRRPTATRRRAATASAGRRTTRDLSGFVLTTQRCIDRKTQIVHKTVPVVSCQRSPEPVFLKPKGLEATPEGDFFAAHARKGSA